MRRKISHVTVAAMDRPAHQDNAPQLAECFRVFFDHCANVHERTDRLQRNLARVTANLLEDKVDGLGMRRPREVSALSIAALGEVIIGRGGCARGDWNVRAAGFAEQAVKQFRPRLRVAKSSSDAENLQLRA